MNRCPERKSSFVFNYTMIQRVKRDDKIREVVPQRDVKALNLNFTNFFFFQILKQFHRYW
jgi:hypothetical protein